MRPPQRLYDGIADQVQNVIATADSASEIRGAVRLARRMAALMAGQNGRFDYSRFMERAGINEDGTVRVNG